MDSVDKTLGDVRVKFREVAKSDHLMISILLETASERPEEARMVEALRRSGEMALEFVAERDGEVIGHIAFARLVRPQDWWALAFVSVSQDLQSRGIGSEIIRFGLDQCRQQKAKAVVVVGDPLFYKRFGFSKKAAAALTTPLTPELTQLYPIAPGTGGAAERLIYPDAFALL